MVFEAQSHEQGRLGRWLEERARRHPAAFSAALAALTGVIVIGLLYAVSPPKVLYQGF